MTKDIFIARQPILDLDRNTFGYELLFRDGPDDVTVFEDPNEATQAVIERAYLDWGMEKLIGQRFGLINADATLIVRGLHRVLPPEGIILELRETSAGFDGETLDALQRAKREGYHFALDNVHSVEQLNTSRVLQLCSLVKLDFRTTPMDKIAMIVEHVKRIKPDLMVVGEKVETAAQHALGVEAGLDLFQGYYFARPDILRKSARPANALAVVALVAETQRHDVNIDRLEQVISGDPSVAYRVLAVVNSSAFGLDRRVESLRHAIVLLGINQVRHLAILLAMSATKDASEELIKLGASRARLISRLVSSSDQSSGAFTVGLLSVTDALFRTPMEELIGELPVSEQIGKALLGGDGEYGCLLEVARACEHADIERIEELLPGSAHRVVDEYRSAVEWADEICSHIASRPSVSAERMRTLTAV
jgi:EAL and modified HD-GYP domain-containing signal transduction protein